MLHAIAVFKSSQINAIAVMVGSAVLHPPYEYGFSEQVDECECQQYFDIQMGDEGE